MNKMILWFFLSCKRQMKRPFFLIFLCLLPVGAWLLQGAETKDSGKIAIAIVTNGDSWNERVAEKLMGEDHSFEFYLCETEAELSEDVMAGRAECGYIFQKGLKSNLDSGKYKRSVTTVVSPSTVAAQLASETVFAGLFSVYGQDLLEQYSQSGIVFEGLERDAVYTELKSIYDKYLNNGSTFSFTYETAGGQTVKKDSVKAVFPIKGVIAVFLFISGLSAAVIAAEDEEAGIFSAVSGGRKALYMSAEIAAPVFISCISALLCLLVSVGMKAPIKEILSLILYGILIIIISFLLLRIVKNPMALAGLIPFFVIISLVACPVFVDLSVFIPILKTIRWFLPPYYYLML